MRGVTAGAGAVLRRAAGAADLAVLLRALVVAALVSALTTVLAGGGSEPALVVGVLGSLVVAWAVAREITLVLPVRTGTGPAVAARERHRALARRPVPRHRDPDAPGHTRSRAPSEHLPAP